ncbi:MAG: Zinc dependent phospholipase [Sporomusa sp.]|nr:Zinc dependent phospholipase [Sporomusa sp.]
MHPESLPAVHTEIAGAKLLLAAASPFQGLFDRPSVTHEFLNKQAVTILSS